VNCSEGSHVYFNRRRGTALTVHVALKGAGLTQNYGQYTKESLLQCRITRNAEPQNLDLHPMEMTYLPYKGCLWA